MHFFISFRAERLSVTCWSISTQKEAATRQFVFEADAESGEHLLFNGPGTIWTRAGSAHECWRVWMACGVRPWRFVWRASSASLFAGLSKDLPDVTVATPQKGETWRAETSASLGTRVPSLSGGFLNQGTWSEAMEQCSVVRPRSGVAGIYIRPRQCSTGQQRRRFLFFLSGS